MMKSHLRRGIVFAVIASAMLLSGCSTAGADAPEPATGSASTAPPEEAQAAPVPSTLSGVGLSSEELCEKLVASSTVSTLTATVSSKALPQPSTVAACNGLGDDNGGFSATVTTMSNAVMSAEQLRGSLQGCDTQEVYDSEVSGFPVATVFCIMGSGIMSYSHVWGDDFNAYIRLEATDGASVPPSDEYFALIPQLWTDVLG